MGSLQTNCGSRTHGSLVFLAGEHTGAAGVGDPSTSEARSSIAAAGCPPPYIPVSRPVQKNASVTLLSATEETESGRLNIHACAVFIEIIIY